MAQRPELTRERVLGALERAGGNRRRAAELLGVGRATLYRWIDRHGLEPGVLKRIGGRWEVVRRLGQGSQATVHLVRDRAGRHGEKALKLYRASEADSSAGDAESSMRREFRTLSLLRVPGLVRVYDVGVDAATRRHFVVMDTARGRPLDEAAAGRSAVWVARVVRAVLRTLDQIHRRGIVHRDIKPSNILVDGGGGEDAPISVVVTDLALSEDLSGGALAAGGTFAFAAPELLRGARATPRTDLFALGVSAYVALTGRLPGDGEVGAREDVAPPSALREDVPPELDRVVLALLAADPAERPADAATAVEALDALLGRADEEPGQVELEMVGRESELETVVGLLDRSGGSSRGTGALAVVGDSGSGKTRFLEACLDRLRDRGWRVAVASCSDSRAGGREPLRALLREALAGADGTGDAPEDQILSGYAASLPAVVPGLVDPRIAKQAGGVEARVGRPQALDLVASLLVDVCERRPLLLAVDDLDAAEPFLLDLVWLLARRAARHPLRLLATTRVAPDAGGRVEGLLQGATTEGLLQLMPLEPLDEAAVRRLAEDVLGPARASELGERVHALTGGHTRFTCELLLELKERRELPADPDQIDLPSTAVDTIGSRLRRVTRSARRALEILAVAGGPRAPELLRRVLPEEAAAELPELLRRRLVRITSEGRIELDSEALRSVLLEALSPEASRELHARWAEALEGIEDALVERAAHLRDSGGGFEIEGALLEAAERLVREWRYDGAIRFFRDALDRIPPEDPRRLAIYPRLEVACREAHERREAAATCREWAEQASRLGDVASEATARSYLAGSLRELREWDAALDAARTALELAERSGEQRLVSLATKSLAIVLWVSWRKREALPSLERALELARTARDAKGQAYTLQDVALLQSVIGRPAAGLAAARESRRLFRESGDEIWPILARSNEALIHAWLGDPDTAVNLLEDVVEQLDKTSAAAPVEFPLENLALLLCRTGRYGEALEAAQRLVDEATRRGRNAHRISGLLCRGEALFQLDDRDAAREHHRLARDLAAALDERRQRFFAELAVARDLRVLGRLDAASERVQVVHEQASLETALRQRALAAIEGARIALLRGDAADAQRWLDDAESTVQEPCEDAPALRAAILLERARAWRRLGRPAPAYAAVEEGLALATHRGPADVAIFLHTERAEILEERGEDARAAVAWSRAAKRIRQIGESVNDPVLRARWLARPDLSAILETADRRARSVGAPAAGAGRREDLASLYEVSRVVAEAGDLDPLLRRIAELAVEKTGGERGLLLLRDDEGVLRPAASVGMAPDVEADAVHVSLSALERAGAGGELLVRDTRDDAELARAASVALFDIRSILCVPLAVGDEQRGALYVDATGSRVAFSEADLAFLRALADQAAIAIAYGELVGNLSRERDALKRSAHDRNRFANIVGESKKMQEIFSLLERFADSELPVLVFGESGTGKELVARALHFNSRRREGPFLSENCAAVPETLLESTLFGYVRGAFTGAERDKPGLFALADGGTLFLDEIGDMSAELQVRLLRVLQEKEFRPVGGDTVQRTDVRIVAATHRDLPAAVRESAFREDLFFRLRGLSLTLPPLRERREDIPLLVDHFLREREAAGGDPVRIAPAVLRALVRHAWPGNVRELENAVQRLALFAEDGQIGVEALRADPDLEGLLPRQASRREEAPDAEAEPAEARALRDALERANGDKARAAALLNISRATLYRRLKAYGLTRPT